MISIGVLFSFFALVLWGVGDFLIQRSVRKFGDWMMIFYIDLVGVIMFTPFVIHTIVPTLLNPTNLLVLIIASIVLLIASVVDFESLKEGKISVVEPIFAFEVPVTAVLSYFVIKEAISLNEIMLIVLLIVGIALVSTKSWRHLKIRMEKGVFLAILTTIAMGASNFIFGFGGRQTDPWIINWFTSVFLALAAFIYLVANRQFGMIRNDWRNNKSLIMQVSIYDNLAWLFFTYSFLYIPITISTGISESYVALAAFLGLIFNKEKLGYHQWVGMIACIIAAVALAFLA
jgi:drug/metabolite transporter (DMT)-like permease